MTNLYYSVFFICFKICLHHHYVHVFPKTQTRHRVINAILGHGVYVVGIKQFQDYSHWPRHLVSAIANSINNSSNCSRFSQMSFARQVTTNFVISQGIYRLSIGHLTKNEKSKCVINLPYLRTLQAPPNLNLSTFDNLFFNLRCASTSLQQVPISSI